MLLDRISHETAVGKALRWPLRAIPSDEPRRILWGPLTGRLWYPGSGPHSMWLGLYERRTLSAFDLHASGVVWDVGAHAGLYSLVAALRGCEVHAFEPMSVNRSWLRRNLEANHALGAVRIYPFALGETDGEARFRPDLSGLEGSVGDGGLTVPVRCGDGLGLPPPAVLKVDVEGGELAVLRGIQQTLRCHRPVVFLETHEPVTIEECMELLPEGYEAERTEPKRYVLHP